ncbi:MAG: aminopeptidase [Exilispira sp.]
MGDFKLLINSININKIIENVEKLVSIPSPTGNTKRASDFLVEFARKNNIDFYVTNKKSVIYKFASEEKETKGICFAAHIDTLGLMVKSVSNDSIKVSTIGGIPPIYAIGDYVTIEASDGNLYTGTILPDNPSAHVNKKLYDLVPNFDDSYVRVDFKFSDDDDIKNHIQIGDYLFLDPKFKYINGFIKTRFLDDKASCAILINIAENLVNLQKDKKIKFKRPIYLYFNVTEETGQGISGLPEIDELYIVDMGVVGNGVDGNEFSVSICYKDSSGPYNFELTKKLERLAKENDIRYVKDIFPYYGSDGSAALRSGADLKVALFGVGVSSSHGYERTHEKGLLNTARLAASIIDEFISIS